MDIFKKIEIVPYDLNWPKVFEKEKIEILGTLKENCMAIHHIGSTSIPGVYSKPKIDIITVARSREHVIASMEKIGYEYRGEWNIPLKYGFTKRRGFAVNLHMYFNKNHPEIELNIAFRDYLRTHSDTREAYSAIKKTILEDESSHQRVGRLSFPVYTMRKRAFINDVLRMIGFNRLRVLKCLTEEEYKAANQFREQYSKELVDFNDKNHEHFILYRGIEIIGYSDINIGSEFEYEVFTNSEEIEGKQFFEDIINQWISIYRR